MELLLEKLGIDWRLFIAQMINFSILLFILYKFLYKPVLGMLERRRETIEKSLEDAKKIEERVVLAAAENEAKIREARIAAGRIVEEASSAAEAVKKEKLLLTRKEVEKIIEQGKEQLAREREEVLRSVREEAGSLVADAVAAVLKDISHEKIDKALIEESLNKIKQ
ncbi:F0F1 ATP synthase subunit B [Candidatus Uhrbacteria bacterium]|nr:F0F1 ATP synthase subunit B [Candidatus Uhrbacteria bacterium]